MYKIENTVSDIKLHEQKIAKGSFVAPGVVKITRIILEKPFKLQVTAVAKVDGKKKKRVRSVEYSGTLKEAVADALTLRTAWVKELKGEIKKPVTVKAVTKMMTLSKAFELYSNAQKIKKGDAYDDYRQRKLFEKHIAPTLGDANLDDIDAEDIIAITNNMKVTRAEVKDGKKVPHPDGKYPNGKEKWVMETRPAADRTKRTIYQLINPIYTHINKSNKIKFTVPTPASMTGLEPLENEKEVELPITEFTKLYHYDHELYQKIFVWLMHGRRFGEVASLRYEDIDLEADEYTIRKENNKARKAMTYKLAKWQRDTLPEEFPEPLKDDEGNDVSRLVFPSVNNMEKQLNSSTVQAHFKLDCTMHDLRHILGGALVNSGVSMDIIGFILGHKPDKRNITTRYSKVTPEVANKALVKVLKEVLI